MSTETILWILLGSLAAALVVCLLLVKRARFMEIQEAERDLYHEEINKLDQYPPGTAERYHLGRKIANTGEK